MAQARASQENPGLALLALLLLRVRRVRRAVAVAAALPHQRLRRGHQERRHDRGVFFDSGEAWSRLWRAFGRSARCPARDVLEFHGRGRLHLPLVLPADRLRRARDSWPDQLSYGSRHRAVLRDGVRARLLHVRWAPLPSSSTSRSTIPRTSARLAACSSAWSAAWAASRCRSASARSTISPACGRAASCSCSCSSPARSRGCTSRSGRWNAAPRARPLGRLPELPEMQEIHGPEHLGALLGRRAARLAPRGQGVLEEEGRPRDRAAQLVDLDPGAAAVLRRLDGVVGRRRQAAGRRLHLHHRPALLARGAARHFGRNPARLLLFHGADLRRPAVDDARDLVADDPGDRHRLRGAESANALLRVPHAGALVRARRRKLRFLDGQHLVLLSEG